MALAGRDPADDDAKRAIDAMQDGEIVLPTFLIFAAGATAALMLLQPIEERLMRVRLPRIARIAANSAADWSFRTGRGRRWWHPHRHWFASARTARR